MAQVGKDLALRCNAYNMTHFMGRGRRRSNRQRRRGGTAAAAAATLPGPRGRTAITAQETQSSSSPGAQRQIQQKSLKVHAAATSQRRTKCPWNAQRRDQSRSSTFQTRRQKRQKTSRDFTFDWVFLLLFFQRLFVKQKESCWFPVWWDDG